MESVLALFDQVADGLAGRRWARRAGIVVAAVVVGLGVNFGGAEWLFDRYVEYRTDAVQDLLDEVIEGIDLPSTTEPQSTPR